MTELVIEFHYVDGDIGVHPATGFETNIWNGFLRSQVRKPSHIVIRPNTEAGQAISNRLHAAPDLLAALEDALDDLEDWARDHDDGDGPFLVTERALIKGRAAIVKAKGGAS